jgi:hypothetical protein
MKNFGAVPVKLAAICAALLPAKAPGTFRFPGIKHTNRFSAVDLAIW